MSSKNKTDIILKDFVNESMLLREFSMYGCEESPGRTYGYNPFSKKCIDITGYEGPDAPPQEVGPNKKPGDFFAKWGVPGSIGAEVFDKGLQGIIDFITDIYLSGIDPKEVIKCIDESPTFSFLGALYGRPFVKILPNLAMSGAKGAYSLLTPRGQIEASADKYIQTRRQIAKNEMSAIDKLARKVGNLSTAVPKFGLWLVGFLIKKPLYLAAGGAAAAYTAGKFMPGQIDILDKLTGSVDDNVFGKESYQNWKCFGAVAVTAVLAGAIVRGGPRALMGIMKQGGTALGWTTRALKDVTLRKSFEKAITKINSKQLTIFKLLEKAGKLPAAAKITLDKSGDFAILKASGLGDDVIEMSAAGLPKELQKLASGGKIKLDPKQLSKELDDMSKSIVDTINESAASNLGKVRGTNFYKRLKSLRMMAGKGQSGVRQVIIGNSSEVLSELIPKLDEALVAIRANEKVIAKSSGEVFSLLSKFKKTGMSNSGFLKLKDDVINNSNSSVEEIVNSAIPSLKSISPDLNKRMVDHFEAVRQHVTMQKNIITDIELAKKSIFGDAKALKELFPNSKSTTADMATWLSGEGKQYKEMWLNLGSTKQRLLRTLGKGKDYTVSGLREAVNALFNNAGLVIAPVAASKAVEFADETADYVGSFEKDNKEPKEVKEMSNKDIKELVAEVLNENSGMGYGKYPYDTSSPDEQPNEDYMEEWKALAINLIRDESRDTAVAIAKILVRDLELFEDVLDLAGQNKSVGSEILRKLKEIK